MLILGGLGRKHICSLRIGLKSEDRGSANILQKAQNNWHRLYINGTYHSKLETDFLAQTAKNALQTLFLKKSLSESMLCKNFCI